VCKPKQEHLDQTITLRLSVRERDLLKAIATWNDVSVSSLLRHFIETMCDEAIKQLPPAEEIAKRTFAKMEAALRPFVPPCEQTRPSAPIDIEQG
jgi:hypothetical protein